MKYSKILPILVAASALFVTARLNAQVVEQVVVTKSSNWVQTSAGAPIIDPSPPGPNYGGPYSFSVDVSGTNLGGITAPTVTLPVGSLYPTQNAVRHNNGVLTYDANDEYWAYGVDANQYGSATANERDTAFAAGTYGMTVNGTAFNLNFPATAFPENTPSVTLTGGTWVRGVYMIDVTQPLTITTNAFTNFNQNADGAMSLEVEGVADQLVFYSDNHAANNFLTQTIPANTLVAGTEYSAEVGFYAITDRRTDIPQFPGSLIAAAYGRDTRIRIRAYSGTMPSATLHGIGDLFGGIVSSEVRDVTRVSNVLYAVGSASGNAGLPAGRDTAVIWTTTGGLMPLPNLAENPVATSFVTASAITPNAAFIASRARSAPNTPARQAVRITTSDRTVLSFAGLVGGGNNSAAVAISGNGSVLYGLANNNTQAVRYTASGPTGTLIPYLNGGDNQSSPAGRGCSLDGTIMVGTSTNTGTGHNGAFRYVDGIGITAIPNLSGGTSNIALAVSPNGQLTLVFGTSASAPQGEFYLHNAANGAITPLGTPNGSRSTNGGGGMTADGSVVVGNLNDLEGSAAFTPGRSASYMHNSHGWHNLQAVVAAAGVNLTGWTLDPVLGMSSDGTMVWGMGTHNGNPEGFVVEFAPGYLAAYTEPATFSTPGQTIVGAWTFGDTTSAAGGSGVLVFYANGYYMHIEIPEEPDGAAAGFERGQYNWNATTGLLTFNSLIDTNGEIGLSGDSGGSGFTATVSGNTLTLHTPDGDFGATRVTGTSPLVGVYGFATTADDSAVVVFLPNGYYYMAQDGDSAGDTSGYDGMEWGTYTWNAVSGAFTATALLDTNGQWGLSHPQAPYFITLSSDLLTLTLTEGSDVFPIPRVGLPAVSVASDFSGDGKADILWSNTATGERAMWFMNGSATAGGAVVGTVPPAWAVSATGDYNGDGKADILWTNTSTGDRAMWLMNGSTIVTNAFLTTVPLAWTASGNGDFNGDGKADILWSNTTTGDRAIWLMNGSTSIAGSGYLTMLSTDWKVGGTADFNGDGKADILWSNTVTGERAMWFMNGSTASSGASLGVVPVAWAISAAADFNGDGKADILLTNTTTGGRAMWLMNGSTIATNAFVSTVPVDWAVGGTGDYNGDGKADILWSNTVTGDRAMWLMNGSVSTGGAYLVTLPVTWEISSRP